MHERRTGERDKAPDRPIGGITRYWRVRCASCKNNAVCVLGKGVDSELFKYGRFHDKYAVATSKQSRIYKISR